jgi:DNA polymerase-3 subunit alpha
MAALLTSEMGDTDKIVKYMEECRTMGLQVAPPDVNRSSIRFSVSGETILFGLAAIKNVGEAAMESIITTRDANGPFTLLTDFCTRVDLRLVNRRVIESLIKAGAFDSLKLPRAHLLATLDQAMEAGQRHQRDRQEGQASFFDVLSSSLTSQEPLTEQMILEEWDEDQRLAYEKEVLGFYLSGHPLARLAPLAREVGATPISELSGKSDGSRVTLFGLVTALKEITTKNGDRMGFLTLEDMGGSVEVTVFPEPFKAASAAIRSGLPLRVRGRVDGTEEGKKVLAEEIRAVSESDQEVGGAKPPGDPFDTPQPTAHTLRIRIRDHEEFEKRLATLRALCVEFRGPVPLYLHVLLPEHEVVVRVRELSVRPDQSLIGQIEELLGKGSVTVEYARRA